MLEKEFRRSVLKKEDIIILFKGGHGFLTKEKLEMIEVKQGPYIENSDKILI